ncbi:MAG: 6-carboxytetrahydropterin synthase [Clostridium sp.]
MIHKYKFKFYINARHSVNFTGVQSNIHPHTWEVVLYINVNQNEFINFTKIEKEFESYFNMYEGKYLNQLECFTKVQPTMENIAVKIFNDLEKLSNSNLDIDRIEVSENPTRTYIIQK